MTASRNLSKMFPEAPACKTFAGAAKRLASVAESCEKFGVPHCVVQREDGLFIAVAIVGDKSSWLMNSLIQHNVCVTNAS